MIAYVGAREEDIPNTELPAIGNTTNPKNSQGIRENTKNFSYLDRCNVRATLGP